MILHVLFFLLFMTIFLKCSLFSLFRNNDNYDGVERQHQYVVSVSGWSIYCLVLSQRGVCGPGHPAKNTSGKRFQVKTETNKPQGKQTQGVPNSRGTKLQGYHILGETKFHFKELLPISFSISQSVRSLSKDVFERCTSTGSNAFLFFSSCKIQLPVDMRRSKTSFLKFRNILGSF